LIEHVFPLLTASVAKLWVTISDELNLFSRCMYDSATAASASFLQRPRSL